MYKCDNNVVDHQSVLINFASGATATHNMVGGSSEPRRNIHIIGTKGEIFGNFEESKFYVSKIDPSPDAHNGECRIEEVDLNVNGDMVGAYGGRIEQLFSIGGGDALNKGPKAIVNRFKPVVRFDGPFLLKKGKTARHTYQMPN